MKPFLKRHSLVIGLVLMFLYTWTIDFSNAGVLPFKFPFAIYLTLGWGFIFVSLFMTWLTLGKEEMVTLFKRFFIWRVGWKWWLVAILLMPALRFAAILLTEWLTGIPADYSHPMIRDVVPLDAPLLALVIPWVIFEVLTNGEEMGWRGYVLPRLQAKYNALVSSLIVGVIWGRSDQHRGLRKRKHPQIDYAIKKIGEVQTFLRQGVDEEVPFAECLAGLRSLFP